MDVIIQHGVAVLQVLPLGNAVRGNQQVDVAGAVHGGAAVAGHGREVGEDSVEVAGPGGSVGFVAGDHSHFDVQLRGQSGEVFVQIERGVLEGGEHQQLAVGLAVAVAGRLGRFRADGLPNLSQLAVALRGDGAHLGQRRRQGGFVLFQVGPPAGQIQFPQPVGVAAPVHQKLLIVLIVIGQYGGVRQNVGLTRPVKFVTRDVFQQAINLADSAFQGQPQRVRRAFQPLEEVGAHHSDEETLAVLLVEVLRPPPGRQLGQPGRVGDILAGLVQRQLESFNALRQILIRQLALPVGGRVFVHGPGALRKLPHALHLISIEPLNMAPGAGDGHAVQQPEKVCAELFHEGGLVAAPILSLRLFPLFELSLCGGHNAADVAHIQAGAEGGFPALGHQVNLIPQVDQRGVHRRCGQHQYLGLGPGLDDLVQQAAVALPAVVAEVVRLVNHHQVVVPPIEARQIHPSGRTGIPGQVGVSQHGVPETVLQKRILLVTIDSRVERPVFKQLARTQRQRSLVAQLKILDNRQSGVGLAQTHAVGQYAAVVLPQLGDYAPGAVLLKLVKRIPDPAILESGYGGHVFAVQARRNIPSEQFVQRLVIDGLWRIVAAQPFQGIQYLTFHILGKSVVLPQPVEPFLQFGDNGRVIAGKVDFQIGLVAAPQSPFGEVGTAHNAGGAARRSGKVHLAVQKVGPADRTHGHRVLAGPLRALPGQGFLLQGMVRFQSLLDELKGLGLVPAGVKRFYRSRLAEQEARIAHAVQLLGQ